MIHADRSILDSYIRSACIVDFYTSKCPSCEKFVPVFERTAPQHAKYKFIKVNLDDAALRRIIDE